VVKRLLKLQLLLLLLLKHQLLFLLLKQLQLLLLLKQHLLLKPLQLLSNRLLARKNRRKPVFFRLKQRAHSATIIQQLYGLIV